MNISTRIFDTCQKKCIANYKTDTLEIGEQVCVERCTKKWFEVYNYIVAIAEKSTTK